VLGVQGLRVVDASIMPELHGGHTWMAGYSIGEKAANMNVNESKGLKT